MLSCILTADFNSEEQDIKIFHIVFTLVNINTTEFNIRQKLN